MMTAEGISIELARCGDDRTTTIKCHTKNKTQTHSGEGRGGGGGRVEPGVYAKRLRSTHTPIHPERGSLINVELVNSRVLTPGTVPFNTGSA